MRAATRGGRGTTATHAAAAARLLLVGALLVPRLVAAQGAWDAVLAVDPTPSPYLSDWETNASIATLTVTNGSGAPQQVRLAFSVVDGRNRDLISGRSEPQRIPADVPAIFTSPVDIAGSTRHDREFEAQLRRTGRLPEGTYRLCIAVIDLSGFQLAEACESFTLVWPDPPLLVAPANGETAGTDDLFFQWTPSQAPLGVAVRYVLQVAEIRSGQLPAEALRSSVLHFTDPDVQGAQLQYPLDAPRLRAGARYAWRVQALDAAGYAITANNGSSEVWTFTFDDGTDAGTPGRPGTGAPAQLRLDVRSTPETAGGQVSLRHSLAAICATADERAAGLADSTLGLWYFGPGIRADEVLMRATFGTDTDGPHPVTRWVLNGLSEGSGFEWIAGGDCDAAAPIAGRTRVHYIARKKSSATLEEFIGAALAREAATAPDAEEAPAAEYTPQRTWALRFGTTVLATRTMTVGKGAALDPERAFFGREIEVKPGINLYGLVAVPEGPLWQWLRDFGGDRREWELTGFLGLASELSVNLGYESGSEGGATGGATLQTELVNLRVAFGEFKPARIPFISSIRAGLEFIVNDSLDLSKGATTASGITGHIIPRFTLTFTGPAGRAFTVAAGFDFSREWRFAPNPETQRRLQAPKVELVGYGQCDCQWPIADGRAWIGDFSVEIHTPVPKRDELIVLLTGDIGLPDGPSVQVGGSLTWQWAPTDTTPALRQAGTALQEARHDYERALARLAAAQDADRYETAQDQQVALSLAEGRVSEAWEALDKAQEALERETGSAKGAGPSKWHGPVWRIRASAGNASITELLDFIRGVIR